MSTLLEKANQLLQEKNDKLIPDNIKKGITAFNVMGNFDETTETKMNIFLQETEPETKDGIWLKCSNTADYFIADTKVFASEEWNTTKMSEMSPNPVTITNGGSAIIGDNIYMFGGGTDDNAKYAYKYSISEDKFTRLANIPDNFKYGEAVAVGDNIYLMGGPSTERKKIYKYNTISDTYTKISVPFYCYQSSAAAIGTDIYVFGSNITDNFKQAYKFNTLTNTSTKLTPVPYNYRNGSSAVVGTDIYLLGGVESTDLIYKYNTLTGTYTKISKALLGDVRGASSVAVGTDIYVFGSSVTSGSDHTRAQKYNTLTNTRTSITSIPEGYTATNGEALFDGKNIYLVGAYGRYNLLTTFRVLSMTPKEYQNKSVIISQDGSIHQSTKLVNTPIFDLRTYFDRVYYRDENGNLLNNIPTYIGNGTTWTQI